MASLELVRLHGDIRSQLWYGSVLFQSTSFGGLLPFIMSLKGQTDDGRAYLI